MLSNNSVPAAVALNVALSAALILFLRRRPAVARLAEGQHWFIPAVGLLFILKRLVDLEPEESLSLAALESLVWVVLFAALIVGLAATQQRRVEPRKVDPLLFALVTAAAFLPDLIERSGIMAR